MKTYKLHVLYDGKDDKEIFRDIVIAEGQNLEQLHKSICKAFDFEGDEMASFYLADESWEKGTEFPLEDLGEEEDDILPMKQVKVESLFQKKDARLVYVYDFLKMSTFMCELIETGAKEDKKKYPVVVLSKGDLPENDGEEGDDEDDDFVSDDPDLAESYFTKVGKASPSKAKKGSSNDDEDDLLADDFEDGYDDDDFGNSSDYDEYY